MNKVRFLLRVWSIAKQYKWRFILSYAVILVELATQQVLPLALGNLMDAALYKSSISLFIQAASIYAVVYLAKVFCGFLQLELWQALNNKYVYGLKVKCYEKILRLKASLLTDMKTGDMLQTINDDTMEFHHIMQRYTMRIVNAGIGTVVSLVIVAFLKWEIALIMAVMIPASVLLTEKVKKKTKIVAKEIREKQGKYHSWLMEILKGMREVKLFSAKTTVLKTFKEENSNLNEANAQLAKVNFTSDNLISTIYFIAQIVFYVVSAIFVIGGAINIAQYITIAAYYTIVSGHFQDILRDNMQFQGRQVAIERVFDLLDKEEEDNTGRLPLHVEGGQIKIEHLSFSYQEEADVLKDFSYTIEPGKCIGIVGASGVGKSTLAHIIIQFFQPKEGSISIDGKNLCECTYQSIRENIGLVSQETIIFDSTIRDNICFGADIPDEQIWQVLDKAYLKKEVEKLPKGIYTMLGKEGQNLSGGQNQRLAIARTLLKNPKIVILDEATSALDEVSEKIVQKALDQLTTGRTSIVISHRLSSIQNADEIIALNRGEAKACGKCQELLKQDVGFRELFLAQAQRLEAMKNEI